MKLSHIFSLSLMVVFVSHAFAEKDKKETKKVTKLRIGIKKRVDADKCKIKSRKGDLLHMHYTVSILFYLVIHVGLPHIL